MGRAITTDNAPAAIGPYSQAIEKKEMLFCSGQLPVDPKTGELVTDSIERATQQALDNLLAVVKAAGYEKTDIVKVNIYLQNMDNFSRLNTVYNKYFETTKPARACVEVSELPKKALVEIEATAMK